MPCAYILEDSRGRVYIGSTTDIGRRLNEHLRGHTQSTRKMAEIRVIWKKDFSDLASARDAERKIKKWKSRKMVDLLIQGTVDI